MDLYLEQNASGLIQQLKNRFEDADELRIFVEDSYYQWYGWGYDEGESTKDYLENKEEVDAVLDFEEKYGCLSSLNVADDRRYLLALEMLAWYLLEDMDN